MTGIEIDVPLARKTLEWVETHPEMHDQGDWTRVASWREWETAGQSQDELGVCGTAGCFAGWLPVMDGHLVNVQNGAVVADVTGTPHVSDWSQKRLGLTVFQADLLFSGANTREHLRGLLSAFTDGEIEPPAFPYSRAVRDGQEERVMHDMVDVHAYIAECRAERDYWGVDE